MQLMSGNDIKTHIKNLIHEETQTGDFCVDLTIKHINHLTGKGAVDFGGSEHIIRPRKELPPLKKEAEDEYGWWHLTGGTYLIQFNESLDLGDLVGTIAPHSRLMNSGAFHVPRIVTGSMNVVEIHLIVGTQGIDIKENARVSSLYIMK